MKLKSKHLFSIFALSSLLALTSLASSPQLALSLNKTWLLKEDGLTQSDILELTIDAPANLSSFAVRLGGETQIVSRSRKAPLTIKLPISHLDAGTHIIEVVSTQASGMIAAETIYVSYPLYVVVSTDWDNTRTSDRVLNQMDALHEQFPDLKLTHFFAPYHYTDPRVSPTRKQEIDRYIKRHRDEFGDEIGIHIHGWCHFIDTTGVPCKTEESFGTDDGTGYTTILAAYSVDDMSRILSASVDMFERHGLGKPTSFRAGGWTADHKVLKALVENGFRVDSSAVPAHRLHSWQGYVLYDWNMAHWRGITETSQPYFPNVKDVARSEKPQLNILEVPDNGVLVDYVSVQDMLDIYDLNHPNGEPLSRPTVYQIGFHPVDSFSHERYKRIVSALLHVEKHSHKKDVGPAVYVTLSQLTEVFKE